MLNPFLTPERKLRNGWWIAQGNLLGFGVSGQESRGLLSPTLGTAPAWWTGGAFGLEASVPGTLVILGVLVAVLRWRVGGATAASSPGKTPHG